MTRSISRLLVAIIAGLVLPTAAQAALTIGPVTWNTIGLDSNNPTSGPRFFPVAARVCSDVATANVSVAFVFDSANANINLRAGSLSTIILPSISAGGCADAYFEVDVTQVPAAYNTTRRYHITATDGSGTVSTATPRELFVEHLISQNRNSISDVKFGPNPSSLVSVPAGGSMNLVVGNTYTVQLIGGTATQGYSQFEAFINFPNTIFQILGVSTTYSADDSPYVPGPAPIANDKLYADACQWENDPNSPNYRSCVGGDFKAGGNTVITTYTIRVISGGGTSQTLNTLLDDFSGSSYHYNSDFTAEARVANVIDPTSVGIAKSFNPNPASINGVSALTITLTNPNPGTIGGYNFIDNLPANMVVATPPAATTTGCGSPSLVANAGSSSISFSNGTLSANSSCIIKVNVTPTATGTLINTTNNLFLDSTDTGKSASASLVVNTAPPPGTGLCNLTLARWNFPVGMSTTAPAPTIANVAATAAAGAGVAPIFSATDNTIVPAGTGSWGSNGAIATGTPLNTANDDYFEFALDTTGFSSVFLNFDALFKTPNGPKGLAVFYGTSNTRPETGTLVFSNDNAMGAQNTWFSFGAGNSIAFTTGLNPSGTTFFRIYGYNSNNTNPGADLNIDNVLFTGCGAAVKPTIAKSFAPNPIAVNGTATLTFTLTNTNSAALTGAQFDDTLPSGVQVAAVPSASTTCGGSPSWAPAAGAATLSFGQPTGATIPASGSCTASVVVTATTAGPHSNVSGFLSTIEGGTTTDSVAAASLTAVLPPVIAKLFNPTPILAGATSSLAFTITNPNQNDPVNAVSFSDTFPVAPASMTVATVPNATTSGCGSPTWVPVAGAGSVSFSGGAVGGGGTCMVTVDVTAPTLGTYNNTSGNVSHIINAQTVNGNAASGFLVIVAASPSIGLLKEVGSSATGPWTSFLPVSGGQVFYRFTVENTGDVPLSPVSLTDDTLNVSACNATFASITLPVAVAANNNHIVTCLVGPVTVVSGSHSNTAFATGTFSGTPHNSGNSTATYATTGLTMAKSVAEGSFTAAGDLLHYSYVVTNSGFATLAGPVTVSDNKATATCPALTTVGDFDSFLDPGETVTCTATYTVTGADVSSASVTNTASATAQGVTSPTDSRTVLLSSAADVSMNKTLTTIGPYTIGQTITYGLVVGNAGPSTATSVQVTDSPTNLTITNVSGGGCAALPCTIASLASGANVTITVTATINAAGAFDNSATVSAAEPDPNLSNNTDSSGNGGTANGPIPNQDIPTLSTLGLMLLGLLCGVAGIIMIRLRG